MSLGSATTSPLVQAGGEVTHGSGHEGRRSGGECGQEPMPSGGSVSLQEWLTRCDLRMPVQGCGGLRAALGSLVKEEKLRGQNRYCTWLGLGSGSGLGLGLG